MPDVVKAIWIITQCVVGFNLVFPALLLVIYYLRKKENQPLLKEVTNPDYAVIITAYKYINTLPSVVSSALNLNYNNFLIYVVADNCDVSSLHFADERVILLKPEEVLAGNVKSHFYAINHFKRNHEIITIIDSDNIIHPEYLNSLNPFFAQGFEAVQGCREAKNLDTTYACLDAARDIYYHYYDGNLLFNAGSSATLSGSGMAFKTALYRDCLENVTVSGAGFDKVLQNLIVKQNKRIAYSPDAIVFDEKTSRPDELVNQRSRWINTWFKYFKFGFSLIGKGLITYSSNQVLFGFVLLRPPLFLFLILSVLMMAVNIFLQPLIAVIWLAGFLMFVASFIIALNASKTDKRIYKSLTGIPKFIFYQLISLSKVRKANTRSVSTRHYHT